jgi:hypothetical protein
VSITGSYSEHQKSSPRYCTLFAVFHYLYLFKITPGLLWKTKVPYSCQRNTPLDTIWIRLIQPTSSHNLVFLSSYDTILYIPATFQLPTHKKKSSYCVVCQLPWKDKSKEHVFIFMFIRLLLCWKTRRMHNVSFNGFITSVEEVLDSLDIYETILKRPYSLFLEVKFYSSLAHSIRSYRIYVRILNAIFQRVSFSFHKEFGWRRTSLLGKRNTFSGLSYEMRSESDRKSAGVGVLI